VLFRDPGVGVFYRHESPYTYFSSNELHLGEISLECSRPGASAVALWATQKLLPLEKGGAFAAGLSQSRQAALRLYERISADSRFRTFLQPELDILVWAPRASSDTLTSALTQDFFETAASHNLHLATFRYPSRLLQDCWPDINFTGDYVTCLRSCLMKPEHLDWLESIWEILDKTADEVIK
jgi:glutamate/tyrosine decarboxylase-like PLP-dependent enzyme